VSINFRRSVLYIVSGCLGVVSRWNRRFRGHIHLRSDILRSHPQGRLAGKAGAFRRAGSPQAKKGSRFATLFPLCSEVRSAISESSTIYTVGHSTRSVALLIELLRQVSVDLLVDVRSMPRSRANPQFNADALRRALVGSGIAYRHLATLGGLRGRRKDWGPSANTLWRNEAFRNYADYAATSLFKAGLDELQMLARDHCCAIMCAEAVWWRCHRRIIADYLLTQGIPVAHIMGPGRIDQATPTPGMRPLADGTIVYPAS
jgi:Protein of unknown function, DUF488